MNGIDEAAADADIHLTYDEYMKCLDAAIEEYERRDKDVYCHETSFRWGFEADELTLILPHFPDLVE